MDSCACVCVCVRVRVRVRACVCVCVCVCRCERQTRQSLVDICQWVVTRAAGRGAGLLCIETSFSTRSKLIRYWNESEWTETKMKWKLNWTQSKLKHYHRQRDIAALCWQRHIKSLGSVEIWHRTESTPWVDCQKFRRDSLGPPPISVKFGMPTPILIWKMIT